MDGAKQWVVKDTDEETYDLSADSVELLGNIIVFKTNGEVTNMFSRWANVGMKRT